MNRLRLSLVILILAAVAVGALPRVVCLPLNNEGDSLDSWYTLGLSEALAYRLNESRSAVGLGFRSLREALARTSMGRQESYSDDDYRRLLEQLRPDYYLIGSYLIDWPENIEEDPRFEVEVTLRGYPGEEELFSIRFTGIDIFAIEVEIYKEVRLALGVPATELELDLAREVVTYSHNAYRWYCRALGTTNSTTQELAHLDQACELGPDFLVAHRERARAHLDSGYTGQALEDILEVFRRQPDDPWTLLYYAQILDQLDDDEKAMTLYRRAALADARYWRIHLQLGRHFAEVDFIDFAERSYETLLSLDDGFYEAWRGLGKIDLSRGEYERALDRLERAAGMAPWDPEFHSLIGQAYVSNGRLDEGIAELTTAVEQDPVNGLYAYQLGYAYYRKGDDVAADEWWRKASLLGYRPGESGPREQGGD